MADCESRRERAPEGKNKLQEEESVTKGMLTEEESQIPAHGSEVRKIGEILPAQEKVEAKIDLEMGEKSVTDHKLHVDKIIKNINTISLELKKINDPFSTFPFHWSDLHHVLMLTAATAKGTGTAKTELSQLLLCDLTLHFNHPMKTENLTEAERNNPLFEEAKISDVSLVSNSFSI
ncbi:putative uncharacterized protein C5orf58 [Plecturocebus cupreus]